MAVSDQFCLRWNEHQNTLLSTFDTLLDSQKLTDVTLWAEGKCLRAHKVVLSACSPYFDKILEVHDEKNPIIVFNDLSYEQLRAMLEYMYRGEVNVSQEQLDSFLKVAESLKIKGLTEQGGGDIKGGGNKKKPSLLAGSSALGHGQTARKRKRPGGRRGSESGGESLDDDGSKSESSGAGGPPGLLQPKVELTEDNGGQGVEDLTMMEEEEEEEYYHQQAAGSSRLSNPAAEGSLQPHPPPDIKDFANWDMTNDGFIGAQELSGNNALNSSQGVPVLETSMISPEGGPFVCDFCQKKYKHKRTLMTHKKYECENSTSVSGPHMCDSCGKVYKHRRNLCAHRKYDCGKEPQFACTICDRKFKFKSNLKAHFNACHKKHLVLMMPSEGGSYGYEGYPPGSASDRLTLSLCQQEEPRATLSDLSSVAMSLCSVVSAVPQGCPTLPEGAHLTRNPQLFPSSSLPADSITVSLCPPLPSPPVPTQLQIQNVPH